MAAFFGILVFTVQLYVMGYGMCLMGKSHCNTNGEKKGCSKGGIIVMLIGGGLAALTAYLWITYYLQGDFAFAYPIGLMEVEE